MPSWKDLDRFFKNDKWDYRKSNSGTDKVYTKTLSNGTELRSRTSKGSKEIGQKLFSEILKQLCCSKEYFGKLLSSGKHSSDNPEKRY